MAQTYFQNPNATEVVPGQQSAAVGAYQTHLNEQNAGQAGWTPLTVDNKYGPLTAAAANFKPTAPAKPQENPLPRVPQESTNTKPIPERVTDQERKPKQSADEQNYSALLKQSKGLIDTISKGYQDEFNSASSAAAARINAGGLAGSSAGGKITDAQVKPIIDRRNTEFEKIYDNIRSTAHEYTQENRANAEGSIKALAANHLDWNEYKKTNPDNYKALVQSLGGDPNVADAVFAMNVPTAVIDNTFNTPDGNGGTIVTQITHDPITNKPGVQKFTLPGVTIPQAWTSEKFGTNAMIYKSPNFDPHDPSTYVTISSDPTNGGALTVTKDGVTTVNGIPVNQTPGSEGSVIPAAGRVATMINLQDPATPLVDVISDPSIGIEGVVAGIIQNVGGSPKGVVNNPGNIKFVGLPGQKDSGVKATDGGTFATYDTPEAGKQAIADLVNKGVNSGKTFENFVNAYTGTSGGSSSTGSGSILTAAGIALPTFNYLTQGTPSLTRMSAAQRKSIISDAEKFLNDHGLDISTFQSEYKAYNDVLQQNIARNSRTKIMENELSGTVDNLLATVDEKELGSLNVKNIADVWAGKQVNDPVATRYAFHFQQLQNELAQYFAATQGKTSPDVIDNQDAAEALTAGMSTGSLQGFKKAVEDSTSKMSGILQKSVDDAQKSVWNLFGVADKFKGKSGTENNGKIAKGTMSSADYVEKVLSSGGHKYADVVASAPAGQIPVLDNTDGSIGFIPESEFSSSKYTRI